MVSENFQKLNNGKSCDMKIQTSRWKYIPSDEENCCEK